MAEGLDRESASDDTRDTSVRRTAVTIRGEGVAPCDDSLFGADEDSLSRGPEWCVDTGSEIVAMNKFELWLALGAGDYSPVTLVWKVGRERWQPAEQIPELACALKLHAQSLLAAQRLGRDAELEVEAPPTQASTPEAPTTHVAPHAGDEALADTLVAPPAPEAEQIGPAVSDRPRESYVVRGLRPKRRTDVRVHLVTGLTALGALAATFLLVGQGRAKAPVATPAAAEAAAILAVAEPSPAVASQPAGAPASMRPDRVEPTDPKISAPQPAKHGKSVSPSRRGQERANRKGH